MKAKLQVLLAFFLLFVACAWGLTRVTSEAIWNSTLDNSCVGCSTPAAAHFTNLQTSAVPTLPLPSQGMWLGWNYLTQGESDFFTHPGSGVGGYRWFNGSTPTQTMSLSASGLLTAAGGYSGNLTGNVTGNLTGNATGTEATYSNIDVNGNGSIPLTGSNGLNLGWNQTGGGGESDFVNLSTASATAFNWYHTLTHTIGSPIMSLSAAGNLTVANVTANTAGTHTGAVVGNASTASALAAAPSTCPSGEAANGIAANGNASCNPLSLWAVSSSTCTTASGAGSTCTTTLNWDSPGFSGAPTRFTCSGNSPSGAPQGPYVTAVTGSTITVQITNGTASQAVASSLGQIMCHGRQ